MLLKKYDFMFCPSNATRYLSGQDVLIRSGTSNRDVPLRRISAAYRLPVQMAVARRVEIDRRRNRYQAKDRYNRDKQNEEAVRAE